MPIAGTVQVTAGLYHDMLSAFMLNLMILDIFFSFVWIGTPSATQTRSRRILSMGVAICELLSIERSLLLFLAERLKLRC